MTVTLKSEMIKNGRFETGDLTDWTIDSGTPTISTTYVHTGEYTVRFASSGIISQDINSVPVNSIEVFGIWILGEYSACFGGARINVTVTYSDTTSDVASYTISALEEYEWIFLDILDALTAGKTITNIAIESNTSQDLWIDDIYIGMEIEPMSWIESQESKPAIQVIPNKPDGNKVNTSIYTISTKIINMTLRLSDVEKVYFDQIFNAGREIILEVSLTDGTWFYSGWIENKPEVYEYRVKNGILKEWFLTLTFKIHTTEYEVN
jgi:hypothetical protein